MSKTEIVLGLPSKGRILKDVEALFEERGIELTRDKGERGYTGTIQAPPQLPEIPVRFLPAKEIAKRIVANELSAGITGLDLLREQSGGSSRPYFINTWLNISFADVVIAIPNDFPFSMFGNFLTESIETFADLADETAYALEKLSRGLRIGTKFVNLTRAFLQKHNFHNYELIYSDGATEGMIGADEADIIVDITSTGETLRRNGLRPLTDVILRSQAVLAYAPNKIISEDSFKAEHELMDSFADALEYFVLHDY